MQSDGLTYHFMTHTGVKPHICTAEGCSFKAKSVRTYLPPSHSPSILPKLTDWLADWSSVCTCYTHTHTSPRRPCLRSTRGSTPARNPSRVTPRGAHTRRDRSTLVLVSYLLVLEPTGRHAAFCTLHAVWCCPISCYCYFHYHYHNYFCMGA
jgi:hypothetical protein